MAFIMHPSMAIEKLQTSDNSRLCGNLAAAKRLNLRNAPSKANAKRPHLHGSMKQILDKTFTGAAGWRPSVTGRMDW
jgi:hypothetical protein